MHDDDLTILAHAATMLPVRPIEKAHREAINRKGHFRRTKHGELVWVEPHQVLAHIAEHGEPSEPKDANQSVWMGNQAMEKAIEGYNVVHAMHRKGLGWVDFIQGDEKGGIKHILLRRGEQHQQDPKTYPLDGLATLRLLPTVIAKGRLTEYYVTSATIIHDGVKVHLARITKTKENPGHAWVVSGYEIIRPVKS